MDLKGPLRCTTTCLVLATLAAAQVRAPFTGTVRGLDGKPLANAQVVCAWQPGVTAFGAADRRETKTDAEGRFALELVVGNAYSVWAIGPADAKSERDVVLPSDEAAGGKQIDLLADMRMAPVSLQVSGTAPWVAEGPLALRIGIAKGIALGPDLAIPGDGLVPLPPLPTDQIQVALVDGRQNVLDLQRLDVRDSTAVAFPEVREFDALVTSASSALDGVHLLLQGQEVLPPARPAAGGSSLLHGCRLVATTDAKGKAHCRIPWGEKGTRLLFAARAGYEGAVSGWFDSDRCENGAFAVEDAGLPLRFELRPREATTVRIAGADAADRLQVRFLGTTPVCIRDRVARRARMTIVTIPFAASRGENCEYSCEGPTTTDGVTAFLGVTRDQVIPHFTLVHVRGNDTRLPEIDMRKLRTFAIEVADGDGNAMACAQVVVLGGRSRTFLLESGRFVTDGSGRAELRIADEDTALYATTATHCGIALLNQGVPSGLVRIAMRPLATMRLRVVDAAGAPVAGARIETKSASGALDKPRPGESEEDHTLACIVFDSAYECPTPAGRTNLAGEILLRFPSTSSVITVAARLGTRTTDAIKRQAADEVRVLTMQ